MRKLNQPEASEMNLTTILKALSDPYRLKIVFCLAQTGEKNCSAFQGDTISKSTLSHHVKLLREAGVLQLRIDGKQHFYSIRWDGLNEYFPGLLQLILQTEEVRI
ncbi:transcriptional regulator [Paenibacillus psychroresistens]|uniref:Transcriptional regulator n=1 Tax=Paenibacillus psychroresistens TaxID=1778678 RepID=A0A6B8RN41_9BACL|nr:metalloregulator ArsR/SmtB family transcription factor [Paenibacillus psychroresistens]QGQ97730.1 transcriptional regulator [Paenibacillus psychroresistens]